LDNNIHDDIDDHTVYAAAATNANIIVTPPPPITRRLNAADHATDQAPFVRLILDFRYNELKLYNESIAYPQQIKCCIGYPQQVRSKSTTYDKWYQKAALDQTSGISINM